MSILNSTTEARRSPPLAPETPMAEYKAGPRMREPTHPGKILKGAIEASRLNPNSFAPLIGMTPAHVGKVIAGRSPISPEMALRLGKVIGNGAQIWSRMQGDYDMWVAEQKIGKQLDRLVPLPKEK